MKCVVTILFILLSVQLYGEGQFQTFSLDLSQGVIGVERGPKAFHLNLMGTYQHPLGEDLALRYELGIGAIGVDDAPIGFLEGSFGITRRVIWRYLGLSASIMGELAYIENEDTDQHGLSTGLIAEGRIQLRPLKMLSADFIVKGGGMMVFYGDEIEKFWRLSLGVGLTYHF